MTRASFDFDTVIDRCKPFADSIKWNRYAIAPPPGILPLWVADMDFAAPPSVIEALQRRVGHGVFGYCQPWPSLIEAVQEHLIDEYGWAIEPEWLVWLPGLVTGLNIACRSVGQPGDTVFTATPVYPPFLSAPRLSQRRVATAPLTGQDGRWSWDTGTVEAALGSDTKLFLLCHPHNPVGRTWAEDELRAIANLAEKHDLIVCSDEIHCGLLLDTDRRHIPFATLGPEIARRSITLMAPSKTFNIPGLGAAFAVIPDAALRHSFLDAMQGIVPHVNIMGLTATEAAYRDSKDWHVALRGYLRNNRDRLEAAIAKMPGLIMDHVEATYLAWIDARELCRERGLRNPQRFFESAGVGLSDGADFGRDNSYEGFARLNFGCASATLEEALTRMRVALGY